MPKKIKKILMIVIGCISFGLGIVGIALPLLPTTPFLLLAAALFLKSSKRLYTWLIGHPIFGKYILSYMEYKAVDKKSKIVSISLLWITIGISILLLKPIWIKLLLLGVAIGVTMHILLLKTLTKDMMKEIEVIHEKIR